jgi:maleate cis-trans isomerase
VAARPALAERFRVPVVTSNQATVEETLAALGLAPREGSQLAQRPAPVRA